MKELVYKKIDTQVAADYTDTRLVELVDALVQECPAGYGLIAELLKRFERLSKEST